MFPSNPNVEIKLLPPLARQRRTHQARGPILVFRRALHQREIGERRGRADGGFDLSAGSEIPPGEDQRLGGEGFFDAEAALAAQDLGAGEGQDGKPGLLRGHGVDAAAETVEFPGRNHVGSVPDVGIADWGAHRAVLVSERLFVGSRDVL